MLKVYCLFWYIFQMEFSWDALQTSTFTVITMLPLAQEQGTRLITAAKNVKRMDFCMLDYEIVLACATAQSPGI